MKATYFVELRNQLAERSWEVDVLRMPWVSLRRLVDEHGSEVNSASYVRTGTLIRWVDQQTAPPNSMRACVRFLPRISQGIVVALIGALGLIVGAYFTYLGSSSKAELQQANSRVDEASKALANCQDSQNNREHIRMTVDVLPKPGPEGGGKL